MLKNLSSISQKTWIAPQWSIDDMVADIVFGVTITSSPGFRSIAPAAEIKPDVHEFTE